MHSKSLPRHALQLSLLLGAMALSACQPKPDEPTAGQRLDGAIGAAERGADKAKDQAQQALHDAGKAGGAAVDKLEAGLSDAAITANINAELAKDAQLSALKINVDTRQGRVELKGQAPSSQARERATRLASAVKGVVSVDNQLSLESRG